MILTARKPSSEPCRTAPFCANIAITVDAYAQASIFVSILPCINANAAVNAAARAMRSAPDHGFGRYTG